MANLPYQYAQIQQTKRRSNSKEKNKNISKKSAELKHIPNQNTVFDFDPLHLRQAIYAVELS